MAGGFARGRAWGAFFGGGLFITIEQSMTSSLFLVSVILARTAATKRYSWGQTIANIGMTGRVLDLRGAPTISWAPVRSPTCVVCSPSSTTTGKIGTIRQV